MTILGFTTIGIAGYSAFRAGINSLMSRGEITEKGKKSTLMIGAGTTVSMVVQSCSQQSVLNKARLYTESFTPEQIEEGLQQLTALEEKLTFNESLNNESTKVLKKEYHSPTITYHKL